MDKKKLHIFAVLESATRAERQRTRAELFFDMSYSNQPLTTSDLISQMKNRGLKIADERFAAHFLEHVSYFRFAAYLRPMEVDSSHNYKVGASFENAVNLYSFDSELRSLIFSAIQNIEISLRAKIINVFSLAHGAMWFIEPSLAIDKHNFTDNLSTLEREFRRSKEDFIKEHISKYGPNDYPPVWKLLELASFGCMTKLFFNFSDTKTKKSIARSYYVPQHEILESWMKSLNALRNSCAHHSRVWNRIMPVMPQIPSRLNKNWITIKPTANRLYAILSCMSYWLNAIKPHNDFTQKFKSLLSQYPSIDIRAMGFPLDWEKEPLWR